MASLGGAEGNNDVELYGIDSDGGIAAAADAVTQPQQPAPRPALVIRGVGDCVVAAVSLPLTTAANILLFTLFGKRTREALKRPSLGVFVLDAMACLIVFAVVTVGAHAIVALRLCPSVAAGGDDDDGARPPCIRFGFPVTDSNVHQMVLAMLLLGAMLCAALLLHGCLACQRRRRQRARQRAMSATTTTAERAVNV